MACERSAGHLLCLSSCTVAPATRHVMVLVHMLNCCCITCPSNICQGMLSPSSSLCVCICMPGHGSYGTSVALILQGANYNASICIEFRVSRNAQGGCTITRAHRVAQMQAQRQHSTAAQSSKALLSLHALLATMHSTTKLTDA